MIISNPWFALSIMEEQEKIDMAIINENGHYIGPLGNVRFYTLNGKNVVATKGGPDANDIKKKPSYAYTRAHNREFGIVSKVTSPMCWWPAPYTTHTKPHDHLGILMLIKS